MAKQKICVQSQDNEDIEAPDNFTYLIVYQKEKKC
jgi:hypothetical protein